MRLDRTYCVPFVALILLASHMVSTAADQPQSDIRRVGGDEASRIADAVVVGNQPLVHTAQLFAAAPGDDLSTVSTAAQVDAVLQQLDKVLKGSGSSLTGLVRLNGYARDDASATALRAGLARALAPETRVALTIAIGAFPAQPRGALVSVDAIAVASDSAATPVAPGVLTPPGFAAATTLPPGGVVYISGQAEKGDNLHEATRKTLAGLKRTLDWLELSLDDVVEIKSFLTPIDADLCPIEVNSESCPVRSAFQELFAGKTVPASSFVEWQLGTNSIEIEFVVRSPKQPAASAPIEYLTPPWMTASPVFCRVTRCRRDALVYIGETSGDPAAAGGEIRDLFGRLRKSAEAAGTDLSHLAKATYYVSNQELIPQFGKIRPEFYDPKRPPAASLAPIQGIQPAGRGLVVDMIAVGKPAP
jgi:enamine deaminase RidA (YjgF/YER057c/UK114 family)